MLIDANLGHLAQLQGKTLTQVHLLILWKYWSTHLVEESTV